MTSDNEVFFYINKSTIAGRNSIKPTTTAINEVNITAPAEISFAIPTSFEYLLWNTASRENSMAELTISAHITPDIVSKSTHIFVPENPRHTAKATINNAAQK